MTNSTFKIIHKGRNLSDEEIFTHELLKIVCCQYISERVLRILIFSTFLSSI